ncbi:hypothetical protein B5782_0753 [Bifidobacterium catenulatum]|uniref:Uncharacterized protein n=1 Tax=Bifidobacterium catenulatum TaxID=1686 RepID=A0A1V8PQ65_9BIFI|nr:hypothetical protein B5782_0753 [Bifidobacterium catenulatum]
MNRPFRARSSAGTGLWPLSAWSAPFGNINLMCVIE